MNYSVHDKNRDSYIVSCFIGVRDGRTSTVRSTSSVRYLCIYDKISFFDLVVNNPVYGVVHKFVPLDFDSLTPDRL